MRVVILYYASWDQNLTVLKISRIPIRFLLNIELLIFVEYFRYLIFYVAKSILSEF